MNEKFVFASNPKILQVIAFLEERDIVFERLNAEISRLNTTKIFIHPEDRFAGLNDIQSTSVNMSEDFWEHRDPKEYMDGLVTAAAVKVISRQYPLRDLDDSN